MFHCDNFEKKSKKRQYIFNSFTVIGFSLMSDLLENKLSYNCVPYIIFLDPWSFNITFYSLKLRPSALSRKIIESKTHDALKSFFPGSYSNSLSYPRGFLWIIGKNIQVGVDEKFWPFNRMIHFFAQQDSFIDFSELK